MAEVTWHATLVARTPAESAPPTLTEVGFLPFDSISWRRELNDPGSHDVTCQTDQIPDPAKDRLRNLKTTPNEIWLYRDGVMVAAGPVVQWVISGDAITLKANGLLYYMKYLRWTTDYLSGADQAMQVKTLIDYAQAAPWSDYGLATNLITPHGVTQYYGIKGELYDPVLDHLYKLGEYSGGFDLDVDVATREVRTHYPKKGTDLSQGTSLDARTIIQPEIAQSADAEAVCSYGVAFGDDDEGARHVYEAELQSFEAEWGRAYGVRTGQEFVNDLSAVRAVQRLLIDGSLRTEQISPELIPAGGFELDDFTLGDTIDYAYDAGLGLETLSRRLVAIQVDVAGDHEQIGLTL